MARLTLDRPAPTDFSLSIVVKDSNPVQANSVEGKVKFRASAPQSLGGDQEDLEIEVEIDD